MDHEDSLIQAFVKRNKRDRYRESFSNPRLRRKFTDRLAHFTDFDPKYRLPIPSNRLFVDNIARELQKRLGLLYTPVIRRLCDLGDTNSLLR